MIAELIPDSPESQLFKLSVWKRIRVPRRRMMVVGYELEKVRDLTNSAVRDDRLPMHGSWQLDVPSQGFVRCLCGTKDKQMCMDVPRFRFGLERDFDVADAGPNATSL